MRQATIIAPEGLAASLPLFFPDTGTVQARGGMFTAGTEGAFANVTGYVDLPCCVAPDKQSQSIGGDFITTERNWTAVLSARYPALHTATVSLKFVTGGTSYGAVVDGDSQGDYTRLRLTLNET